MFEALTMLAAGAALATPLWVSSPAHACGGGFGEDVEIEPDQTIVFAHDGSTETYVLQPSFCGASADFGLIVPIPGDLLADPELGDDRLYVELDDLTEPIVEVEEVCLGGGSQGGNGSAGGAGGAGGNGGVDVISVGSVGIFDWVQLEATSAAAFTDWLDERAFPYEQEAMGAFEHYVDAGWKFLAFTVMAAESGGASGSICGDFGPIMLSFESAEPVVPARIAAADANSLYQQFQWRVFAIAAHKLQPVGIEVDRPQPEGSGDGVAVGGGGGSAGGFLFAREEFAGELDAAGLERYPTLAGLANAGAWVTELQIEFEGMAVTDDFAFEPADEQTPYREVITEYEYVECSAGGGGDGLCSAAGPGAARGSSRWPGLLLLPLALLALRRTRRH